MQATGVTLLAWALVILVGLVLSAISIVADSWSARREKVKMKTFDVTLGYTVRLDQKVGYKDVHLDHVSIPTKDWQRLIDD